MSKSTCPPDAYNPGDTSEGTAWIRADGAIVLFSHVHEDKATDWVYASVDGARRQGWGLSAWRETMAGAEPVYGRWPELAGRFTRCKSCTSELRREALRLAMRARTLPRVFPVWEGVGLYSISLEWEHTEVLIRMNKKGEVSYEIDEEPAENFDACVSALTGGEE